MSLKKLLNSESESSLSDQHSFKKFRAKSVRIVREPSQQKRPNFPIVKVAKENAVPYEEFLNILQKPTNFVIEWDSNNRNHKFSTFTISSISGNVLLHGKADENYWRAFDSRNRLFLVLQKLDSNKDEVIFSVPNTSLPLATLKEVPTYMPYNKRYRMNSEHFSELECNVELQKLPSRFGGSLWKYTVTYGRKTVAKVLQPSTGEKAYLLVDENISVFQKTGLLAMSIFASKREMKNRSRLFLITVIFLLVFVAGFWIVATAILDIRNRTDERDASKFPNKMKATTTQLE